MTHRTAVGLGGLLATALIVAACGGDEATAEPAAATEAPETAVTEAPVATEAPAPTKVPVPDPTAVSGPGTANLTIGNESWAFVNVFCAFNPEDAGNERVSFTASATGNFDDTRVQMSVDIQDPDKEGRYEGDGVIQLVSINDIEDFENPAVSQEAVTGFVGAAVWSIKVDGPDISAEPIFDDGTTDRIEKTPGTVTVTCP